MNKLSTYLIAPLALTTLSLTAGADAIGAKTKRFNNAFDKNADGVVSEAEYVSTRSKWGKSEAESKKLFRYHDKNKDGEITLEEFLASK